MERNFKNLKRLAGAVVLGLAAANAYAAPISLTCTALAGNDSLQVTLDEGASTAAAGDDPVSSANFTDAMVTWGQLETVSMQWQFHKNYSLNRNTGALNLYGAKKHDSQEKWTSLSENYNCAIAKRLF
jgi:hypothetical protein